MFLLDGPGCPGRSSVPLALFARRPGNCHPAPRNNHLQSDIDAAPLLIFPLPCKSFHPTILPDTQVQSLSRFLYYKY